MTRRAILAGAPVEPIIEAAKNASTFIEFDSEGKRMSSDETKYIGITGWEKDQAGKVGKDGKPTPAPTGPVPWLKLHTTLLDEFIDWPATQQLAYLKLLVLRARRGCNLDANRLKLARSMGASKGHEVCHIVCAIDALIVRGCIYLTNQQNGPQEECRGVEKSVDVYIDEGRGGGAEEAPQKQEHPPTYIHKSEAAMANMRLVLDSIADISGGRVIFTVPEREVIAGLLESATPDHVKTAFDDFWRPLDDYQQKFAAKDFLARGSELVRLAQRREKERAIHAEKVARATAKLEAETAREIAHVRLRATLRLSALSYPAVKW
jgi:hypothetical protein